MDRAGVAGQTGRRGRAANRAKGVKERAGNGAVLTQMTQGARRRQRSTFKEGPAFAGGFGAVNRRDGDQTAGDGKMNNDQ